MDEDERGGDGSGGTSPRGPSRSRAGRVLVVVVAAIEAAVAAVGAAAAALSGVQGGSLVLAGAVAGVAGGTAYLLLEVARGFSRGRRWPTGVFVTAQLLVALVALSLGGRAVLTAVDNPGIAGVTLAALVMAGTGLTGVGLMGAARAPGEGPDTRPPAVF